MQVGKGTGIVLALGLLLAACGGQGGGASDDPGFIAVQKDFAAFRTWNRFDLGTETGDGVHADGARAVYLNQLPPKGSATFPVGTILVKTIGDDDPKPGNTFAMVKRGGAYNRSGASGWEWLELTPGKEAPLIIWRGVAPPAGESYLATCSASPNGCCNGCHAAAAKNDFVPNASLQLSEF